ncbi:EAL domain-containing protein [Bacillus sp. BRMEA1]|uniref:EAL domain-containing protein n=1 Tax=Neobacillus endophyticus TaxID=2738405 RepID=UPI0015673067|nr:EAL domain-containing protein [Neobacillus endophyticus]NRD76839.1 EAL domain-containing protein [Neobacillus endophyticus]
MYSQPSEIFSAIEKSNLYTYLKGLNNRGRKEFLYYKRLKELHKIMKRNDLDTFFQPILDLNTGETMAFEALNRPAVTNVFPNTEEFYEFVGQSNQVFLFECFCRNLSLKRFISRLKGAVMQGNPLIFLNIHPNVLLDSHYHSGETLQLLAELGIEPQQVVFELTERSAVTDFTLFEKVLSNYRSQGFRIAIDDVGSGYNSLKTLIYLKPEFIKLDRSLIQTIDQNLEQQQLVTLIVEYAKQSATEIIAEGIERIEELAFISEHGVHYGQGYALGRPFEEIKPGKIPAYSR